MSDSNDIKDRVAESLKIQKELEQVKRFRDFLKHEITTHESMQVWKPCVRREVKYKFLGLLSRTKLVDIEVPSYINIRIQVECTEWIKELEQRAEEALKPNNK